MNINDLPYELLLGVFQQLHVLQGRKAYALNLVPVAAVCRLWFDITLVVHVEETYKREKQVPGDAEIWKLHVKEYLKDQSLKCYHVRDTPLD